MSQAFQFGGFLDAMFTDTRLKNRIIIWTFLVLVVPAAFLMTIGVPEKPLLIGLVGLLLPVQLVAFASSRRKEAQATEGLPGVPKFWKTAKRSHVIVWTDDPLPAGVPWSELLERANAQNVAVVSTGHTTTYKMRVSPAQMQLIEELIAAPAEPRAVAEQQRRQSLLVQQATPPQVGNLLASAFGV